MCLCCSKQLRETSKLRCTRPNRTSKCSRCSRFNKSCLAVPVKYFAALEGVQRAGLDLLSEGLHQLSPSHLHLHPAPRARLHPRLLGPWPLLAPRLALLILRLVPAVAPDAALMPPPPPRFGGVPPALVKVALGTLCTCFVRQVLLYANIVLALTSFFFFSFVFSVFRIKHDWLCFVPVL